MRNPARPIQKIAIEDHDFSLDKAVPYLVVAIDAQIDRDDASDDFIKEELHAHLVARRDAEVQACERETHSWVNPCATQ
jgi:hypothetical protein